MFTDEGIATVNEIMRRAQASEQQGVLAGFLTFEVQHRCRDGRLIWGEVLSKPERDARGNICGYHGITREITERKRLEDQVRQLAFYDPLTKLPNRRLLNDRLSQSIVASLRNARYGAVMFLDLDNFKPLNDTYGHAVGDLLLIEAAARLKGCVRQTDTVARFGGDEFVVMISELEADRHESALEARVIAEKIRTALSEPYRLTINPDGRQQQTVEHRCSASIGVVLFVSQESSPDDVLKWADAAMYQAKDAGRNSIHFYEAAP
jgi:diguanylate cyclase (GGDEF)-like protein